MKEIQVIFFVLVAISFIVAIYGHFVAYEKRANLKHKRRWRR